MKGFINTLDLMAGLLQGLNRYRNKNDIRASKLERFRGGKGMIKKPAIYILGILMGFSLLIGCSKEIEKETSFVATVLENNGGQLLVEPVEGSRELASADKIMISIGEGTQLSLKDSEEAISLEDIEVGSRVEIFYNGGIAESYPAQINSIHKIVLLNEYTFTASDENFLVKTYIDKLKFKEDEEISLYSTIEYIGQEEGIDIWSGEPYFHHMIYKKGEVLSGGLTLDVLKKTYLKKGEIYTLPFTKSGGYSEEDPKADFFKSFYSEETLKLPKGQYTFSAATNFALDEEQKEKVQLKSEFIVEVE